MEILVEIANFNAPRNFVTAVGCPSEKMEKVTGYVHSFRYIVYHNLMGE